MRLENFEVTIPEGIENSGGYVELPHGTQYRINLRNHLNKRLAAEVKVDGKNVGIFRLNAYHSLILERPSGDKGKFTFYRSNSPEAIKAEVGLISDFDRGLISVTFKPEKERLQGEFVPIPYYPIYPYGYHHSDPIPLKSTYRGPSGQCCSQPDASANCGPIGSSSINYLSASAPTPIKSGITGLSGHSNQNFVKVGNLDYDETGIRTINLRLICLESSPRPLRETHYNHATPVPQPVN